MYLCKDCRHVFYEPERQYIEGEYYPEPHDRGGCVCVGGDCWVKGCPNCGSEEYTDVEFDGICPTCCAEIPNAVNQTFNDYVHFRCPRCAYKFIVDKYGDIEEDDG